MSSDKSNLTALTGGEWKNQLVFVPDVDHGWGETEIIKDFWLIPKMADLIDDSQEITRIEVYKKPFAKVANHQFVVLETTKFHWSIEKDSKQIVIQRGSLDKVKNFDIGGKRTDPVEVMSSDKGTGTMKDLIEFLFYENELWRSYNLVHENCQNFAKRVFDKFADTQVHDIGIGSEITGF
ncbi:uncharacterized protein LOC144631462 [Oculina patagonica]